MSKQVSSFPEHLACISQKKQNKNYYLKVWIITQTYSGSSSNDFFPQKYRPGLTTCCFSLGLHQISKPSFVPYYLYALVVSEFKAGQRPCCCRC